MTVDAVTYIAPCPACAALARWSTCATALGHYKIVCPRCDKERKRA